MLSSTSPDTALSTESSAPAVKVLSLFGTRPEVIKFAPVIRALDAAGFETINVCSSQHTDLIQPLLERFEIRIDHNLEVMRPNQTLNGLAARVLSGFDEVLNNITNPDIVLVQGDTTTAAAGAIASYNRGVAVGHIEAGLRSGNRDNPFPEEMNRRLISQIATLNFAATEKNRSALLSEGHADSSIIVTGNPVIDSLLNTLETAQPSEGLADLLSKVDGQRLLVLTTHRRESFGETMAGNLEELRDFIAKNEDISLVFPVHPNPNVKEVAYQILGDQPRIHLIDPLPYEDFTILLSHAWLLVSDSGGIQEEAPSLRKPVLVIRENTERMEAVEGGTAKLIGTDPATLRANLEEVLSGAEWVEKLQSGSTPNPFGNGTAGANIAQAIADNIQAGQSA